jgi:hypothetical protein
MAYAPSGSNRNREREIMRRKRAVCWIVITNVIVCRHMNVVDETPEDFVIIVASTV